MFTWGSGKGLGNGGRQNTERSPKRVLGIINDLFLPFFHLTNFFFFFILKKEWNNYTFVIFQLEINFLVSSQGMVEFTGTQIDYFNKQI